VRTVSGFTFYLGIHHGHWLRTVPVPVFVSHVTLAKYRRPLPKRLPGAIWALDSGAFSQIGEYGRWVMTPGEYVKAVRRYRDEIGGLQWAAPMDWMCEPGMLAKTGLTIAEHQRRTIESVQELRELGPDLPIAPVLQGWDLRSYIECVHGYADAGIDLASEPVVGLGSVCRRQNTDEIGRIVTTLADQFGLGNLHGFGVKLQGVAKYGSVLASADSMAWSTAGRHVPGCSQGRPVKNEANCLHFALEYRERVLSSINPWHQTGLAVCA
jgi:hypothetical protein